MSAVGVADVGGSAFGEADADEVGAVVGCGELDASDPSPAVQAVRASVQARASAAVRVLMLKSLGGACRTRRPVCCALCASLGVFRAAMRGVPCVRVR